MSPMNKLSKDLIIEKAFDFINHHGLEALSMRKLAYECNVKAMSLYNHISNKNELIDEVIDKLVGLFHYEVTSSWQETFRNRATIMKDVLLKHFWATKPLISTMHVKPNFLSFYDKSIGFLKEAGFSYGDADQIISISNAFIYGYVLHTLNFPIAEEDYQTSAEEHKDFFDKNLLPHLWSISNEIRVGTYTGIFDFELGLSIIISGIEHKMKKENKI